MPAGIIRISYIAGGEKMKKIGFRIIAVLAVMAALLYAACSNAVDNGPDNPNVNTAWYLRPLPL
jgi:hypothetical protein